MHHSCSLCRKFDRYVDVQTNSSACCSRTSVDTRGLMRKKNHQAKLKVCSLPATARLGKHSACQQATIVHSGHSCLIIVRQKKKRKKKDRNFKKKIDLM